MIYACLQFDMNPVNNSGRDTQAYIEQRARERKRETNRSKVQRQSFRWGRLHASKQMNSTMGWKQKNSNKKYSTDSSKYTLYKWKKNK